MVNKHYFDEDDSIFVLTEEPDCFRLRVEASEVEPQHVEDFLDTTVEWLSSNPEKGLLIDFKEVRSVCHDFVVHLFKYYGQIKAKGLYVRFVNVAPEVAPYVGVSDITVVLTPDMLPPEKPHVSAKVILQDLAAGFSDRDLMEKYDLSPRGLRSMFRKLIRKGLITDRTVARRWGIFTSDVVFALDGKGSKKKRVVADEVMKDIAANMSGVELMAKYKLSEKGLRSLMKKLYEGGFLAEEEYGNRMLEMGAENAESRVQAKPRRRK
jgi:anti-anti-sigma regulatory factor